ncbi:MAG: acyl dehydratase [Chloroflexi bacterium]|nr:acyl dehydratase [Chloroflexota bacterium]|tara:strand:- start:22000 stop:22413 length:414 start_codon:yes stop_codon:yes gene_type:complete
MGKIPEKLKPIEHVITQEHLIKYAEASGDYNPLHLDEEFARNTPYGKTIAHGMLILAFISALMTSAFGNTWLRTGKLKARFRAPVFPGDVVKVNAQLKSSNDEEVVYQVIVINQNESQVITGDAKLKLDSQCLEDYV